MVASSLDFGRRFASQRRLHLLGVGLLGVGFLVMFLTPYAASQSPNVPSTFAPASIASLSAPRSGPTAPGPQASTVPTLDLSVADAPNSICALQETSCPAGVGISRVTLTASAPQTSFESWPAVDVAFVIETAVYDGVYDPTAGDPGHDQCAQSDAPAGPACEESNGVPFFVADAQQIANSIQDANPHSGVKFALVDYFATKDQHDDGDGAEYHVDIGTFIPAGEFGSQVEATLGSNELESGYRFGDSDLSDNILHSSSITALYGAIIGSNLNWGKDTHHVVVWIGDTAPRDPSYTQDYCVSPSDYDGPPCQSSACEPAYSFGAIVSPNCEGWVTSQNGNVTDSIAELARTASSCTDSIGGVCTVDTIDLWSTPTDPSSPGWPAADATAALQGGPNGVNVDQNVARVLLAGCDLASATGGTWNGPSFFSCPSGQTGTLQPEFLGPYGNPNLQNPSLFAALRGVGFGPVTSSLVATGTSHPLFTYVPFGAIQVLPGVAAQFRTVCELPDGSDARNCPTQPIETVLPLGPGANVTMYGWNWSTVPADNVMFAGDTWIASFWVLANGPPYGVVPVDACTTAYCEIGGSHAVAGEFTSATYLPVTNTSLYVESFPLGTIGVESPPTVIGPPVLPPPAPVPPPPPIATPAPLPILSPIGVGAQVGVASLSLQAAAAGFIAAGFTTISVRNRPMSLSIAAFAGKNKPVRSRFEEGTSKDGGIGRFE
ncbi:MAG TPA: hypothetical protein VK424_03450 [Thermoplasmata archaeon]|nr:hypothetical protein [Thermoplasmata archaeon]